MAHKKGAGSTKNGRDSNSKRLGVKVYGNQPAKAGSIIVRQRGSSFHPGQGAGMGRDYTIYATVTGHIYFKQQGRLNKKTVCVAPLSEQDQSAGNC